MDIIWKQIMVQENPVQLYSLVCNALVNVCIPCQNRERYGGVKVCTLWVFDNRVSNNQWFRYVGRKRVGS